MGRPEMITKRLGEQLRARRRELRLTQQELADLAGVSVRSIIALELGKPTVRFDVVSSVLTSLGLTLEVNVGSEPGPRAPLEV